MKFDNHSSQRRSRRQSLTSAAPAQVESLESRALLAGPQVVSPTGTIGNPLPVISWEAVSGADNYDLWVSDLDTRTVLFVESGLHTTSFTPTEQLSIGRIRIWARANFSDGSTTGWGPGRDVNLQVVPTVTGPVNTLLPATPQKLNDTQPEITWTSAPGARSFEIYFSDQTRLTSTTWKVTNLTPLLDLDGNTIPDGHGDVVREEIRSFEVPEELPMGQYRVFMRTTDFSGNTTAWSPGFNFEVAPAVTVLRPTAPSFQNPALLEWSPVPGATHYEVWVGRADAPADSTPLYNPKLLTTTSFQIPVALPAGNYAFYVRAKLRVAGRPEVVGIWSNRAEFGTIQKPVITGPVGVVGADPANRIVTDARPTIEWTAIDKVGRYEIWIDRGASTSVYLKANASTNFYQLPSDIQAGNYFVWVRAVSTTGVVTAWSEPYRFSATGGAPLITSPVTGGTTIALPSFTWAGVAEAETYELQLAWIGVDFDYLQVTGITSTSYGASDVLEPGSYRVWVRAIKADGTALAWSAPVTFFVVGTEQPSEENASMELAILTESPISHQLPSRSNEPVMVQPPELNDADVAEESAGLYVDNQAGDAVPVRPESAAGGPISGPADWPALAEVELIEKLAQACSTGEWWSVS